MTTGILRYPFLKFLTIDAFCALFVSHPVFLAELTGGGEKVASYVKEAENGRYRSDVLIGAAIAGILFPAPLPKKQDRPILGALGILSEDAESVANSIER